MLIKILDENVSNIIAAGEVVENPASMIKELYENSIDAKANKIIISTDSKLSYFKIIDDGHGMDKEDIYLSIERHATSKLKSKEDIFNLTTFGFRGEALASISSVSKLTLSSKRQEDKIGHKIITYAGNIVHSSDIAMNTGTIIEIRDLFYNTPARKKFLRKDVTELNSIKDIVIKLALSQPNVSTSLIIDNKTSVKTSGTGMDNTIIELLGKNIFKNLKKFEYGYLGNSEILRGSKNYIYTYINNRYCKSNTLERAVIDAYYTKLMKNKYPFAIILYDLDPSQIDVNVHPSKKNNKKFSDDKIVYKQIRSSIENFFYKDDRINYTENSKASVATLMENIPNTNITNTSLFEENITLENIKVNNYDIISQVFDTYILVKNDDSLDFYDQHAAHERIRYEELKDKYYNKTMTQKQLLLPELLDLSSSDKNVVLANKKIFEDFKFEIDEISESRLILRSVPDFEFRKSYLEIIKSIIESIVDNKNIVDIREYIIISMACRSSIMAGKKLSFKEMQDIVEKIHDINKFNCPHGRPVISKINKDLIDKLSKRKL